MTFVTACRLMIIGIDSSHDEERNVTTDWKTKSEGTGEDAS